MEALKNISEITDEELRKMLKEQFGYGARFIGPDDTFRFECRQCGECCRHRNDIILNPFDVYQGAKALGISCREFISEHAAISLGRKSRIPLVLVRCLPGGMCSLLEFDIVSGKYRCRIHDVSPCACKSHPVGRVFGRESGDAAYILIDDYCSMGGNTKTEQKVKDWMSYHTEHGDEIAAAHRLQTVQADGFSFRDFGIVTESLFIANHLGLLRGGDAWVLCAEFEAAREFMNMEAVDICYSGMDTAEPFIPQAEERIEGMEAVFDVGGAVYGSGLERLRDGFGLGADAGTGSILETATDLLNSRAAAGHHGSEKQILAKLAKQKNKIMKKYAKECVNGERRSIADGVRDKFPASARARSGES